MPPESLFGFSAYAVSQKLSEEEALQKGMGAKAVEFVKQGAEIYIRKRNKY
jgi:hypothetical protein